MQAIAAFYSNSNHLPAVYFLASSLCFFFILLWKIITYNNNNFYTPFDGVTDMGEECVEIDIHAVYTFLFR